MNNNLRFDFTAAKSTNTIFVNREFATELSLVWDAFTQQEILDQWGRPNLGRPKPSQWTLKLEVGDL